MFTLGLRHIHFFSFTLFLFLTFIHACAQQGVCIENELHKLSAGGALWASFYCTWSPFNMQSIIIFTACLRAQKGGRGLSSSAITRLRASKCHFPWTAVGVRVGTSHIPVNMCDTLAAGVIRLVLFMGNLVKAPKWLMVCKRLILF